MNDPRKYVRYGQPLFINKEKVVDPANTFILPMFIKPGRTHFMLRTPMNANIKARVDNGARVRILNYQTRADVQFRFYYNRHIVPSRQEKVPGCKYYHTLPTHQLSVDLTISLSVSSRQASQGT